MALLRDAPKKPDDKTIPVEAVFKFFSALPESYRDLAMTRFFVRAGSVMFLGFSFQASTISEGKIAWLEAYRLVKAFWNYRQ